MQRLPSGGSVFGAFMAFIVVGPVLAEGHDASKPGLHRHASAKTLPAEIRYRDPRYRPGSGRPTRLGPPTDLIHAYLPRTTETPIYNEPPSRFPLR